MRPRSRRSTPAGEHRPVMLSEILEFLAPLPGQVVVDCTLGYAGHAGELLRRVGAEGKLIAFDLDRENLDRARIRLEAIGYPFHLRHGNFAGLQATLAELGISHVHGLIADLGMSSMQVDDPERGFSYSREGPLDMRMDRTRGKTAAQILATISQAELREALHTWGDEPQADAIAHAIVQAGQKSPLETTTQLANLIQSATKQTEWRLHPSKGKWKLHPAARTFQALRILVNRELANLQNLLRVLPTILAPGGTAAIISFHSGEDRLIKSHFRDGLERSVYADIAADPIRASYEERGLNPRSRSAKLRWARRASDPA